MAKRKTGKPPIAFERGIGVVTTDPAGHPAIVPFAEFAATIGAGSGDVHGPASSVDGDLAVFNGATGKILKDTGAKSVDVPSDTEKAALAGTNGTPSGSNKYVTNTDPRLASGGAGINQLTGDVAAGPGVGSQAATLAASGVVAGTYGDSTHVPQVTVDAKGRATSMSSVAIAGGGGGGWIPLVDGAEPPAFLTDGAGVLILVAYP